MHQYAKSAEVYAKLMKDVDDEVRGQGGVKVAGVLVVVVVVVVPSYPVP